MPVAPLIEQSVQSAPLPAPRFSASIAPVKDPYDDSLARAQNNTAKVLSGIAADGKKKADETSVLDAQKQLDDFEATRLFDAKTGFLTQKGKNAINGSGKVMADYDQRSQEIIDSLSNDDQKLAVQKLAASRRDNIYRTANTHELQESNNFTTATTKDAQHSSEQRAALYFNNPQVIDSSIANAREAAGVLARNNGLPEETAMQDAESGVHLTVLTRLSDENPKKAVEYFNNNQAKMSIGDLNSAQKLIAPAARRYKANEVAVKVMGDAMPKINRDEVVDYVIHDLEGGDKLVTDSNGAAAKFGINQAAHPEVDVATLDEDGAKKIAVEGYWNKFKLDQLPADMRLPVLSFAFTNEKEVPRLIEESGNDPRKFIELGTKFYQGLATSNPDKYGASLDGWMNRQAKVTAQVDAMRGVLPSKLEVSQKVDAATDNPEVADEAKKLIDQNISNIEAAKNQGYKQANEEAWKYQQVGRPVPTSVEARMNPKDATEMRLKDYQPDEYERVRRQVSFGAPVDLEQYRWRFAPQQFEDLLKMQGDPVVQQTARSVDKVIDDSRAQILGHGTIKTKDDYDKISNFRQVMYSSIDAQEKVSGKKLTPDDITKIGDRMLIKPSSGWFSGNGQVDVEGVPRAHGTYFMGGTEVSYENMISALTLMARARNLPTTPDVLAGIYQEVKTKGMIADKYQQPHVTVNDLPGE